MRLETWFLANCKNCFVPDEGILKLKNQVSFLPWFNVVLPPFPGWAYLSFNPAGEEGTPKFKSGVPSVTFHML